MNGLLHILSDIDTTLGVLATWLIYAITAPMNMIPALYAYRSDWRRYDTGKAFLFLATGLALVLDVALLYWVLGDDYAGRGALRFAVYLFLGVGTYWILMNLLSLQRMGDEEYKKRREDFERRQSEDIR